MVLKLEAGHWDSNRKGDNIVPKKIGFIGLGQMGKWIALNLHNKTDYDVVVYDLSPEAVAFVTEQGPTDAPSAAAAAAESELVFLSLPSTDIVEAAVFDKNGVAETAAGTVVVDLGTTAYMATLDFSERLAAKGVQFADAPVSGMEARARDGELTIMFGGAPDVFEQLQPALDAIGNLVLYMGGIGSGQLTKLVNQLLFNISAAAVAEILPMSIKLGLDPEKVVKVVNSGTGRSFASEFFAPRILEDHFSDGYPLSAAYKDMVSAAEICVRNKIPLPLVHAATNTYQMALAEGYGHEDKGAMIKVFERILGVQFRKKGEQT
jgi:3-hydroxyisobutyrate dehydrogenase-like beta-hydroxyacid dehydrogenase